MKYLMILFAISLTSGIQAQAYYYYQGEKVSLKKLENQYYVEAKESSKKRYIENNTSSDILIKSVGSGFAVRTSQTKSEIIKNQDVKFANPMYQDESNLRLSYHNEVIVKLKEDSDVKILEKQLVKTRWQICSSYEHGYGIQVICDSSGRGEDGLFMANHLHETGLFEYAEPNFIAENPAQYVPNDRDITLQYQIHNDGRSYAGDAGTTGSDMNVRQAWDYTTGCNDIVIAIIDNGVDLNHPDLIPNLIPGFDALGQGTAGAPTGDDNHGTPCAGTAAARGDNGIGIAGVAYSCSIMPIRAFASQISGSSLAFASAIDWAWMNGADVLSNSWGWSSSNAISDAVERAVTDGRNGLGCVVLASAGNSNRSTSIGFPARDPNVIAVGASNMCDERKSGAIDTTGCFGDVVTNLVPDITGGVSCDNDRCWGSNYGNDIDIVAPGVSIRATYRNNSYGWFRGTSAACPNAAGVAALILSAHDDLLGSFAKNILLSTARKAGAYSYNVSPAHPINSWNNEMGHGVADAQAAVLRVLQSTSLFVQNRVYDNVSFNYLIPYEIQAGRNVKSGPTGDVSVGNSAFIQYDAGRKVLLKPGFQAQVGSGFRARIVPQNCPVKL